MATKSGNPKPLVDADAILKAAEVPAEPPQGLILILEHPAIVAAFRQALGVPVGDVTEQQVGDFVREHRMLHDTLDALRANGADRVQTLDDAAAMLLRVMQPAHQDKVRDCAQENRYPEWVVLLGAVARNADNMELVAGEFDPDWLNDPGGVKPVATAVRCQAPGCGLMIPNAHRGQTACCNGHGSGKTWHGPRKCEAAERAGLPIGIPAEEQVKSLQTALTQRREAALATAGGGTAWGEDGEPL